MATSLRHMGYYMYVNRSQFIKGLVGGAIPLLSGCTGGLLRSRETRANDMHVQNVSNHDDVDVAFSAKVIRQATKEEPARVEVSFINRGAERTMYFGATVPGTFPDRSGTLVLIPDTRDSIGYWDRDAPQQFIPDSREDCWRALNTPVWGSYLKPRTVREDERLTERYTLLTHTNSEECFPPGSYHFKSTFKVEAYHSLYFDMSIT